MNIATDYFSEVVGQSDVKRKLSFYIDGYQKTSMIPHFMFVAERGFGKTMMATKIAKHLVVDGKPKRCREINCSTIKSVAKFVEQVMLPFVQDNDCTILFDEASELPKDLTMSLLTMLNPNDSNRNTFVFGDMAFDINFKKHSFLFATTEPQKIFHALMSRCHRIDFDAYKPIELMTIVKKNVDKNNGKITFTDEVSEIIPTVLRHNPRCAQMMASDVINYCSQFSIKLFGIKEWEDMKKQLGIKPMGLNATEIRLLKILKDNTSGLRLVDIAARLGLTSAAIQRDTELFLMRNELICMDGGRKLTTKGLEYLKNM